MPLQQHLDDASTENRLRTTLLSLFAATAVALACIGLYGTLSYLARMLYGIHRSRPSHLRQRGRPHPARRCCCIPHPNSPRRPHRPRQGPPRRVEKQFMVRHVSQLAAVLNSAICLFVVPPSSQRKQKDPLHVGPDPIPS